MNTKNDNKANVLLYALSTCVWCKKTKQFLLDLNIKFEHIDVDLLSDEDRGKTIEEIAVLNPIGGFPTIVINQTKIIVGFKPEAIKEALK